MFCLNVMKVLHEPQLDTILMIEKAIIDAEDYPTRMQLWRSLPRKVQYQTYKRVLDYLEASNKIIYDEDGAIVYTGVSNDKLRALVESAIKIT